MATTNTAAVTKDGDVTRKSDALTDVALTLPIFVAYHLGVAFLPIRNAADPVTAELRSLAKHSLPLYWGLTLAIGAAFFIVLWTFGQKRSLTASRFVFIALEGALYAVLMRAAGSYIVGSLRLAPGSGAGQLGVFSSVVMALGAGFYEEVAFRVIFFGLGLAILKRLLGASVKPGQRPSARGVLLMIVWGLVEASAFSGWHYVGSLGDSFDVQSFVFRAVCGLTLTTIYAVRGFAPAVWTHAIYDLWVMVLG